MAAQDEVAPGATDRAFGTAVAGNADRVDGIHAVGSGATVLKRAKKLVATNRHGYLPNDIIKRASNSDRLDGLDSTAFARTSSLSSYAKKADLADYARSSDLGLPATVRTTESTQKGDIRVSVQCGAKETRVGGGFAASDVHQVVGNRPIEPNGWEARLAVASDAGPVSVYAVCLKLSVN